MCRAHLAGPEFSPNPRATRRGTLRLLITGPPAASSAVMTSSLPREKKNTPPLTALQHQHINHRAQSKISLQVCCFREGGAIVCLLFHGRQTPNGARVECPAESRSRAISKQMRRKTKKQKQQRGLGGAQRTYQTHAHAGDARRLVFCWVFFRQAAYKNTFIAHTSRERVNIHTHNYKNIDR